MMPTSRRGTSDGSRIWAAPLSCSPAGPGRRSTGKRATSRSTGATCSSISSASRALSTSCMTLAPPMTWTFLPPAAARRPCGWAAAGHRPAGSSLPGGPNRAYTWMLQSVACPSPTSPAPGRCCWPRGGVKGPVQQHEHARPQQPQRPPMVMRPSVMSGWLPAVPIGPGPSHRIRGSGGQVERVDGLAGRARRVHREGVVAERGEPVDRRAGDLSGLVQQPRQDRRSLPGRFGAADRLLSEVLTVTSSPVKRTAPREEDPRPAPPSQHVKATAVTGPTPYSSLRSSRDPRIRRAIWVICQAVGSSSASSRPICIATATCQRALAGRCAWAASASQCRPATPTPRPGSPLRPPRSSTESGPGRRGHPPPRHHLRLLRQRTRRRRRLRRLPHRQEALPRLRARARQRLADVGGRRLR
jgi:hypothetical protein